jgi:hypothetical protein
VEVAGDESSGRSGHAHLRPGLAAPPAPCPSSLLDGETQPSDERPPPCPPAPPPGAASRLRAHLAPVACLRSLLTGRSFASTSLSSLSTRLVSPARGCAARRLQAVRPRPWKNCELPTTSCFLGLPLLLAALYCCSSLPCVDYVSLR